MCEANISNASMFKEILKFLHLQFPLFTLPDLILLRRPFGESFSFFLSDDTFNRGKLLTDNVFTADFSLTRKFSSTIFDVSLPLENC